MNYMWFGLPACNFLLRSQCPGNSTQFIQCVEYSSICRQLSLIIAVEWNLKNSTNHSRHSYCLLIRVCTTVLSWIISGILHAEGEHGRFAAYRKDSAVIAINIQWGTCVKAEKQKISWVVIGTISIVLIFSISELRTQWVLNSSRKASIKGHMGK